MRAEELDAAIEQLGAARDAQNRLEGELADTRAALELAHAEHAALTSQVELLRQHNRGMADALTERDRELKRQFLDRLEAAERHVAEREAHLEAQATAREARMAEVEQERVIRLTETIEALRRIERSRAWRLGHGATRLLRRLTFRPSVKREGGVEQLIRRLEPLALPTSVAQAPEDDVAEARE